MKYKTIQFLILISSVLLISACLPPDRNKPGTPTVEDATQPAPVESTKITELPSEKQSPSSTKTIIYINKFYKENNNYMVNFDAATMHSGRKAIEVAMDETNCPIETVFDGDCAASLNNNFYISNPEKFVETMKVDANAKIEVNTADDDSGVTNKEIDAEGFYSLWTETDAFSSEGSIFTMEFDSTGTITKISQQYLP